MKAGDTARKIIELTFLYEFIWDMGMMLVGLLARMVRKEYGVTIGDSKNLSDLSGL